MMPRTTPPPLALMLLALGLVTLPATVVVAGHDGAHAYEQTDKLWPPEPSSPDHFGASLAADGDILAVGPGDIQLYHRSSTGWIHGQTLEAPAELFEDREHLWGTSNGRCFGFDLALDAGAGVLAIGDPCLDVPGNVTDHERDAGAVYIYEQALNGTWELVTRFLGPVNGDWNDQDTPSNDNLGPAMGFSVAVNENTIVAGAPAAVVDGTPLRGKADVYERQGDGTWTHTARWTSPHPDGKMWDQFGTSVATAGDRIAIGAPSEATDLGSKVGAVHLYEADGQTWEHSTRITPALAYDNGEETRLPEDFLDGVAIGASFGEAVAFDEDASTLVVGSSWGNRLAGFALPTSSDFDDPIPFLSVDGVLTNPWGVAYVFDHTAKGYSHTASLENPDHEAHSGFGRDLAVNAAGDTVVVGAYLANQSEAVPASVNGQTVTTPSSASDQGVVTHHPSTGAAYVFERSAGWACSAQLSGDDTDTSASLNGAGDDFFGTAVAIAGPTVWAGAPNNGDDQGGTVYAFAPDGPATSLLLVDSQRRCGPSL